MLVNASGDTLGLVPRGLNQVPHLRKSVRACLCAVCRKHALSISWEGRCDGNAGACILERLFDCQWCSQCGLSFLSSETVFLEPIRDGWGLRESGASVSWLPSSCSQVSGTCNGRLAEVAPGWEATFAQSPLTHWPLNYPLSCLRCAATIGRQGRSLQYGWHVPCFPSARHNVTTEATLTKHRGVTW